MCYSPYQSFKNNLNISKTIFNVHVGAFRPIHSKSSAASIIAPSTPFFRFSTIATIKPLITPIGQTFIVWFPVVITVHNFLNLRKTCARCFNSISISILPYLLCFSRSKLHWNPNTQELNSRYILSFIACYDLLHYMSFPGKRWNVSFPLWRRIGLHHNFVLLSGLNGTVLSGNSWYWTTFNQRIVCRKLVSMNFFWRVLNQSFSSLNENEYFVNCAEWHPYELRTRPWYVTWNS